MESNKKTKPKAGEENDFPGYPHYDPKEDIENKGTRVPGNFEDEKTGNSTSEIPANQPNEADLPEEPKEISETNDFDVTAEDLEALGPPDLSLDMGEDEQLKHRIRPVDFAGEDLDVPGAELDDESENNGSEDEENNVYSLGGDEKD